MYANFKEFEVCIYHMKFPCPPTPVVSGMQKFFLLQCFDSLSEYESELVLVWQEIAARNHHNAGPK
jgi:hypothetical protein